MNPFSLESEALEEVNLGNASQVLIGGDDLRKQVCYKFASTLKTRKEKGALKGMMSDRKISVESDLSDKHKASPFLHSKRA